MTLMWAVLHHMWIARRGIPGSALGDRCRVGGSKQLVPPSAGEENIKTMIGGGDRAGDAG